MENQTVSSPGGEHEERTVAAYKQTNHFQWKADVQTESLRTFLHFLICANPSHKISCAASVTSK